MKTYQRGTDKAPIRKRIFNINTGLLCRLKNGCEKLTQKQRKVTVWALLTGFTVLVAVSVTDIFMNGTELSEPKHIAPIKILDNSSKDMDSLKITNDEREQQ
jgi:hypothetical protein